MDNASDAEQLKKAQKKEEILQRQEEDDLVALLSTKSGRRFYWNLMCECGIFRLSMTGNSQTFFNEGERSVGLKLLAYVNNYAPEAYPLMLKESKEVVDED